MEPDILKMHQDILNKLHRMYEKKNADYGDSFHKVFLEEGYASSRIRLSDKLERFKKLSRFGEIQHVQDESIRDTLLDLANYAIMTVMEIDRKNMVESEDPSTDNYVRGNLYV